MLCVTDNDLGDGIVPLRRTREDAHVREDTDSTDDKSRTALALTSTSDRCNLTAASSLYPGDFKICTPALLIAPSKLPVDTIWCLAWTSRKAKT